MMPDDEKDVGAAKELMTPENENYVSDVKMVLEK